MSLRLMSAIIHVSSPSSSSASSSQEASESVLAQLLECVQQCQKRYGGKTELATEFDNCVAALCLTLESVFSHGLRQSPPQTGTLKHVSDIVTNTLHLNSDICSFWPFVKEQLTKHERERYEVLKHIWTDLGRGRAFIRSSLNERSLERYFHTVLSNPRLLKTHYESWALLRDEEKSSMLPNMAAGLGSILFAVSINKPELNGGTSAQRSERLKSHPEPIIEAPIREPSQESLKQKRKRKVAKQIISFDDNEDVASSSSVPSSSSSVGSDKPSVAMDPKRKLSLERSGSCSGDKFVTNGTLTPVDHISVGELTPVSIVKEPDEESPDTSDDIIEVPSDISAVLTAVETRNKEEADKLCGQIAALTKENGCLKEQVKKYVGAIQMLRSDENCIRGALEIEQLPDYKSEAKLYERKLVQVAEMHAELMDFNVHLQQTLCQRDGVIERLRSELEDLRGPSDELGDEAGCSVNVWIPSAFLTGGGSDVHHVYQIFLRAGSDEWNIYRRYAQFYSLHTDLKKLDPAVATFDFPPKKSIGKKDSALVEDRRKRLQTYLRRILSHWPELACCTSRFMLEQHLAFFKEQKDADNARRGTLTTSASRNVHYAGL